MRKDTVLILALISIFSIANLKAVAKYADNTGFDPTYLPHTTKSAIDFKKKDALQWYTNNVDKKKFYYEDKNHSAVKEIAFLKKRALKWHERNSQL